MSSAKLLSGHTSCNRDEVVQGIWIDAACWNKWSFEWRRTGLSSLSFAKSETPFACLLSCEVQVNSHFPCYQRFDRGRRRKVTYFPGLKESKWNCPQGRRSKGFCISCSVVGRAARLLKALQSWQPLSQELLVSLIVFPFCFFQVSIMTAAFLHWDWGISWHLLAYNSFCSIWQDPRFACENKEGWVKVTEVLCYMLCVIIWAGYVQLEKAQAEVLWFLFVTPKLVLLLAWAEASAEQTSSWWTKWLEMPGIRSAPIMEAVQQVCWPLIRCSPVSKHCILQHG